MECSGPNAFPIISSRLLSPQCIAARAPRPPMCGDKPHHSVLSFVSSIGCRQHFLSPSWDSFLFLCSISTLRVLTVSTISLIQSTILSLSRFYLCPVFLTDISCRLVDQTCMSCWSCSSDLISTLPMRLPLSLFIHTPDSRHSFLLIREVLHPKCIFSSLPSSLSFVRCVLPHSND